MDPTQRDRLRSWGQLLLALERHTDDIAGERDAVLDYADLYIAAQENP